MELSVTPRRSRPAGCYYKPSSRTKKLWWAPRGRHDLSLRTRTAICVRGEPESYALMDRGSCEAGFRPLASPLECEYAAFRLGGEDVTAGTARRATNPFGCYAYRGGLWYNANGDRGNDGTRRRVICARE